MSESEILLRHADTAPTPRADPQEPSSSKRRQKKSKPCRVCQAKRLRCDQQKPACNHCYTKGLKCSYKARLKFVQYDGKRNRGREGYVLGSDEQMEGVDLTNMIVQLDRSIHQTSAGLLPGAASVGLPAASPGPAGLILQDTETPPCVDAADPDIEPSRHNILTHQQEDTERTEACASLEDNMFDILFDPSPANEVVDRHEKPEGLLAPSTSSTSYLQRFYGSATTSPLPLPLADQSSRLVSHYFSQVCALYAAYDSHLNPFRTTIARLWTGSAPIYYAMQSMAAAHLANCLPNMAIVGVELQQQAYSCLRSYISCPEPNDDQVLLTLLLLGLTTSWHETSDIGHSHLSAARTVARKRIGKAAGDGYSAPGNNQLFFDESLIYWEMIMSFMAQEPVGPPYKKSIPARMATVTAPFSIRPHPWTGVAPHIQILFAEVGKLLCHVRQKIGCSIDCFGLTDLIQSAADLEEDLLAASVPCVEDIVATGDDNTRNEDFVIIAEVTRCCALLMLYRAFPALLELRMGRQRTLADITPWTDDADTDSRQWMTSLALHGLNELRKISSTSGTRFLQLLPLHCLAVELHPNSDGTCSVETHESRCFALRRLYELAALLPAKPILRMVDIVREVWRQFDLGSPVFWVDVMLEQGWQTFMG